MSGREQIASGRVEELRKEIAKAIAKIADINQFFENDCIALGWNVEVALDINDAIRKLGVALANLDQWNDGDAEGAE